ncbi:MAG: hypothetical protein GY719_01350 [bacterium]|nr:hypothetical protein [bacterium]
MRSFLDSFPGNLKFPGPWLTEMESLRGQFEEELNSEGEVMIAGQPFLRAQILHELAPEAYGLAFDDWIEARKTQLLEKADSILEKYDNEQRFEQFTIAYRAGGMAPFVGAGMSFTSGFPLWTNFLFQLCDESHVETEDLQRLIDGGEYEDAAQLLHDDLGPALFNENIQASFARERIPAGPVVYLPKLFPKASILTTNFDGLIERLFEESDDDEQGIDRVVSGRNLGEVQRQMAGGTRVLVKLHGDCRQVADRVLLRSEYETAYADEEVVEGFFNRVVFGRALLFLGCSLSKDRTVSIMKQIVAKNGSDQLPRHYSFLGLRESDDRVARKKHLSEANIFPIWYEAQEDDESIEALFTKLLEE